MSLHFFKPHSSTPETTFTYTLKPILLDELKTCEEEAIKSTMIHEEMDLWLACCLTKGSYNLFEFNMNNSYGGLTEIVVVYRLVLMEEFQLLRNSTLTIFLASIMMILLCYSSLMMFNEV